MPTNNHPNRGWRVRMRAGLVAEFERVQWRPESGALVMTQDQLREKLGQWYAMGYEAGRASLQRPKAPT